MQKVCEDMIKEIPSNEYHLVRRFAETDVGRNYFILLGLTGNRQVYDKIYGEYRGGGLRAALFRRKSGVLQFFAPGEFDLDGFVSLISTLEYDMLIGPRSYCDKFLYKGLFTSMEDGAYISKLDNNYTMEPFQNQYKTRNITVKDLDEIVKLYKGVFQSFSSKEIMEEKLNSRRGRGICIEEDGKIISVAQTDFEIKEAAVIVGVATNEDNRGKGLATKCLESLCNSLINEGKNLYLQYDNLEAGKIYERLGFKNIDQVIHYKKSIY